MKSETIFLGSLVVGMVMSQNVETIKKIALKATGLFFKRIDIPYNSNQFLFPKLQTFLKKCALFGTHRISDNGNNSTLTGTMLTPWPFSIIHVSTQADMMASVFLHRLSWSSTQFLQYLDKLNSSHNIVRYYTLNANNTEWQEVKVLECREIPLLYDNQTVKELENGVNRFLSSKADHLKLGKSHKFTTLIYGPVGSGKTTLIKYLSMKYQRNVYIINPADYFNASTDLHRKLEKELPLNGSCEGGIILFEDIDRYFASLYSQANQPNISKFLNFLDGLCTPDDLMIVLTANYEGNIPEAIKRDGRIDLTLHLSYVNDEIVTKTCQQYGINAELIEITGDITTSNLITQIENNLVALQNNQCLTIIYETVESDQ